MTQKKTDKSVVNPVDRPVDKCTWGKPQQDWLLNYGKMTYLK